MTQHLNPRWTVDDPVEGPRRLVFGSEVWIDWDDIPSPSIVSDRLRRAAFDALVADVQDAATLRQARELAAYIETGPAPGRPTSSSTGRMSPWWKAIRDLLNLLSPSAQHAQKGD